MKITGDWLDHPGTQAVCASAGSCGPPGAVRRRLRAQRAAGRAGRRRRHRHRCHARNRHEHRRKPPVSRSCRPASTMAPSPSSPSGKPHEVTTFRRDVETDGRRAVVAFSTDDRGRRRAPRLHHERALRRPARHGHRPAGRPARPAGAPRPLCRRRRNPHPRGLPAHPALLPLSRRLWRPRRRARPRRPGRLRRALPPG